MKKKVVILGLFCFTLLCSVMTFSAKQVGSSLLLSLEQVEALTQYEEGGSCKWKTIDCPGLGTGSYDGCLDNGDGNPCYCGSTTRTCN